MPLLNGEDGVPNPFMYDATGFYGSTFSYTTPELNSFDAYKFTLYVDFALMELTVVDASLPSPVLGIMPLSSAFVQLSWSTNYADFSPEATTSLLPVAWTALTNSVVSTGDRFTVELETTQDWRFFRLRK